jgi:TBC1 domain family member 2
MEEDSSIFRRWRKSGSDRAVPGSVKTIQSPVPGSPVKSGENRAYSSYMPKQAGGSSTPEPPAASPTTSSNSSYNLKKMEAVLESENIDLTALRKLSWNGVPSQHRPMVWQLLLGYMPTLQSRREATMTRKRKEYVDSIATYFEVPEDERSTQDGDTLHQILVDLPRTSPNTPFFHQAAIQKAMERILYIWSIRHPASGYVQGMNDLLTPILMVFMYPYVPDVLRCDLALLDPQIIMNVEADSFWCLTKLLDNIQDHYTSSQPGLQRMVLRLEDLMRRLDNELHEHLEAEGVQYMQFAFRWMNCVLLREIPLRAIVRVWDTYLSEERKGFDNFHVYVCAVVLKTYRDRLLEMQFQDILMFLQDLPTAEWGESEVEPILSQAFILSHLFENSPSHLT